MAHHLLLYSVPAFKNVSTEDQIPCQHCRLLVGISKAITGDLRQSELLQKQGLPKPVYTFHY